MKNYFDEILYLKMYNENLKHNLFALPHTILSMEGLIADNPYLVNRLKKTMCKQNRGNQL